MPLAETPAIDARVVIVILVVLALMLIATVAAVVLGFVWAGRAGRGSRQALVGWIIVAVLEGLAALPLVFEVTGRHVVPVGSLIALAVLGAQALVFRRARARTAAEHDDVRPEPPPST